MGIVSIKVLNFEGVYPFPEAFCWRRSSEIVAYYLGQWEEVGKGNFDYYGKTMSIEGILCKL